jgi:adenylate cyclase
VLGFRYDEALRAVDRALQLSPNLLSVQWNAGIVRLILGEGDVALGHFERIVRFSPIDPATGAFVTYAGLAHVISGRYEKALAAAQRVTQENPSFVVGHCLMVRVLSHFDRIDEAKLAAQRLLELAPQFTVSRYQGLSPVKDPEYRRRAAEMFRAAGVPM